MPFECFVPKREDEARRQLRDAANRWDEVAEFLDQDEP